MLNAKQVAAMLEELGTLLELQGERAFRTRAYHKAAESLRDLSEDLSELSEAGRLTEIPGIGKAIALKIEEILHSGTLPKLEAIRAETPRGLISLLRIPGLGPQKLKFLHDELKITSLDQLRAAAEAHLIAPLKGFGPKSEQKILEGIKFIDSTGDRILQSTALRLVQPLLEVIRSDLGVVQVEVAGSLRRRAETIGDLDLLFAAPDPALVIGRLYAQQDLGKVIASGSTLLRLHLFDRVQADIRGVTPDCFAAAFVHFTGSTSHNMTLRRRARDRGFTLNDYGLEGPGAPESIATEADLYRALGLSEIPPELREDDREITAAEAGGLPTLIQLSDLKGTFHCHTDWSDGGNTLEEMATEAASRGLAYLGIADHSRSAAYAGGLSIDRVRAQWDTIDELNERVGPHFRIFKGIESDILPDGSLDYPDEILDGFDYVVASVHSAFGQSLSAMTERVIKAIQHPSVTMLGHPTGRLLLKRDAYEIDMKAVIEAAAESRTMIEINANPHRLDLDDRHARLAHQAGVPLVINPDAHATSGFDDLYYGIGVARRAGLAAPDIVNTRSLEDVSDFLLNHRGTN